MVPHRFCLYTCRHSPYSFESWQWATRLIGRYSQLIGGVRYWSANFLLMIRSRRLTSYSTTSTSTTVTFDQCILWAPDKDKLECWECDTNNGMTSVSVAQKSASTGNESSWLTIGSVNLWKGGTAARYPAKTEKLLRRSRLWKGKLNSVPLPDCSGITVKLNRWVNGLLPLTTTVWK